MVAETPWSGENVTELEAWKAGLKFKADRSLEPKAFCNYRLMLTFNGAVAGKFRLNRFTNEVEVQGAPWALSSATAPLSDRDIVRAREWLQGFNLTPTKDEAHAALSEAAAAHSYDPVTDYLDGLIWDGKPRIDAWLINLFGVRDTPYARAVGSKWLISACARAYRPGCKADYMLVLEGPQDIGKSAALRALAGPDWFMEFTAPLRDNKMFVEQTMGKWIVEFPELASIGPSNMETVKAVITTQVDRVRLSYAHTAGNYPRRSILAGTVNPKAEGAYLTDETGNKRFWPVRCTAIDMVGLVRDRDQLWAEAASRYALGEHWWLTDEQRAAAIIQQAARVAVSPWEDWLKSGRLDERDEWTSSQLLERIGVPVKDQTNKHKQEVAQIMTRLGWRQKVERLQGHPTRIWRYTDVE